MDIVNRVAKEVGGLILGKVSEGGHDLSNENLEILEQMIEEIVEERAGDDVRKTICNQVTMMCKKRIMTIKKDMLVKKKSKGVKMIHNKKDLKIIKMKK